MKLNANFQSKQPAVEEAPCEVSKVICLTDKEYAFFRKHLMYDYDFLRKNADGMGFRNGIRQCVLVMGETSEDGVLVDSSGYGYARYTAPFLGARSYMALREQNLLVSEKAENLTAEPDWEGNGSPCMSMGGLVAVASFPLKFLLLTVNSYFPSLGVCLLCKSGKENSLWKRPATSAPRSLSLCTTG